MKTTLILTTVALPAGLALGQVIYSDDFTDGGTAFNANFSQFGTSSPVWGIAPKIGYTNANALGWQGSSTTATDGCAYYTGAAANGFGMNGASGRVRWDFRPDSETAVTAGDTIGFSIMGNPALGAPALSFGTRVVSHSAAGDNFELIFTSGGITQAIGNFFVPDDSNGSGSPDYWSSIGFSWNIAGGNATINYNASGLNDEDGTAYPAPNSYSITGATTIAVDPLLLGDTNAYLGFCGHSDGIINTPNSAIDNIGFQVIPVPEPSSVAFAALGAMAGFLRRKR